MGTLPDNLIQQINDRLAKIEERLNGLTNTGTVGRPEAEKLLPQMEAPPLPVPVKKTSGVSAEPSAKRTTQDRIAASIREWDDYFKRNPSGQTPSFGRSAAGGQGNRLSRANPK